MTSRPHPRTVRGLEPEKQTERLVPLAPFDPLHCLARHDVDAFEACASGPAIQLAPGCDDKDFDGDNDTDHDDFAIVQRCISGEDNPAVPTCAD